jgi:hypothetical protein
VNLTRRQLEAVARLLSRRYGAPPAAALREAHRIGRALELAGASAPPRWRCQQLRVAYRNPAFIFALLALGVTGLMVWLTWDQIACASAPASTTAPGAAAGACSAQPLPVISWPGLLVALWIVLPPIWFFLELYLRDGGADDREMLKTYHDYARTIWLALAAVLAALYGLALKP